MPSSPSANFYDLASAAQSTARLTGKEDLEPATPAVVAAPYTRFSADRFAAAAPAGRQEAPAPESAGRAAQSQAPEPEMVLGWDESMAGPAGWAVMLARAQEAVGGHGAFVVDPQGLVIASGGMLPGDGNAEGIGSRLAFAFEQADRMGSPGSISPSLSLQIDDTWLTGVRVAVCGECKLVVGIAGSGPLSLGAIRSLVRLFVRKAMGA